MNYRTTFFLFSSSCRCNFLYLMKIYLYNIQCVYSAFSDCKLGIRIELLASVRAAKVFLNNKCSRIFSHSAFRHDVLKIVANHSLALVCLTFSLQRTIAIFLNKGAIWCTNSFIYQSKQYPVLRNKHSILKSSVKERKDKYKILSKICFKRNKIKATMI